MANATTYYLPAVWHKILEVGRRVEIAYVSGSYRSKWGFIGVLFNILHARRAAKRLWDEGYAVICPHLNSAFMCGVGSEVFIRGDVAIIKRLRINDVLYMLKGWEYSNGSKIEHFLAKTRGLKIMYE